MSLANYNDLKQAVSDWSKRTDVSTRFDDFLLLAETEMLNNPIPNGNLKIRKQEKRATATLSTTSRFLALPDGYIKMRSLVRIIDGGTSGDDIRVPLKFRTPEQFNGIEATGTPTQFKVTSQIELNVLPELAETIEMQYIRGFIPLTSTNITNDVLTNNPNIYLFGVLMILNRYAEDLEEESVYQNRFVSAIKGANKKVRSGQYGPRPRIIPRGRKP